MTIFNKRKGEKLLRAFCICFPALWLFLPNLALLYFNNTMGLSLKSVGLLITVFCSIPITLLFSKNLKQFWLWNSPFAAVAGLYAIYIAIYHDIPYDGMWFALWNTSFDTIEGVGNYFFQFLVGSLVGFGIYCLCISHPIQKTIIFSRQFKEYFLFDSTFLIATILILTNLFSNIIPIQRMIDQTVVFQNYPYGMLLMMGKTKWAFYKHNEVQIAQLQREHTPKGREIYIFVLGEAARYDYWNKVSHDMQSSLLTEPDLHIFNDAASQATLTGIALPLIFTGQSTIAVANSHSLWPTIAKAAGCTTGWFTTSTEPYNYAYENDFYDLNTSQRSLFGLSSNIYDDTLTPKVERTIKQGPEKLCLVVHLIGSHFDYTERYRPDNARYPVDTKAFYNFSSPNHLVALRNAYLNSMIETNILLENILAMLKNEKAVSFFLYTADHAESFDDDSDHQYFHGNLHPAKIEAHVPFFVWASPEFQQEYPQKWRTLIANQSHKITTQQILPTLMDAMAITPIPKDLEPSLFSAYDDNAVKRMVLLPQMELVPYSSLR